MFKYNKDNVINISNNTDRVWAFTSQLRQKVSIKFNLRCTKCHTVLNLVNKEFAERYLHNLHLNFWTTILNLRWKNYRTQKVRWKIYEAVTNYLYQTARWRQKPTHVARPSIWELATRNPPGRVRGESGFLFSTDQRPIWMIENGQKYYIDTMTTETPWKVQNGNIHL